MSTPDPRPVPTPEDELLAMAGEAARALMTDGIGVAQRLARVHRLTGPVGRMTQGEVRDRIAEALRPWLRAHGDRRAAEAAAELVAALKSIMRLPEQRQRLHAEYPAGTVGAEDAWSDYFESERQAWLLAEALIVKYEART